MSTQCVNVIKFYQWYSDIKCEFHEAMHIIFSNTIAYAHM